MTPTLPYPLTEADLTPTLAAAMPPEMKGAFVRLFNAMCAEGVKAETSIYRALDMLCWDLGWMRSVDGSYERDPWFGKSVEKAGKVLSAANAAKVLAARDALSSLLRAAGVETEEEDTEDEGEAEPMAMAKRTARVVKVTDAERRVACGWASVAIKDGDTVIDLQGDMIDPGDLENAAWEFMKSSRAGKANHEGDILADIVGSLVLTKDVCEGLGLDNGGQEGWVIQMQFRKTAAGDAAWEAVKRGELAMFSIGGTGERVAEPD